MNNSPTNTRFGKTCLALFGPGLPGKKPHPFVVANHLVTARNAISYHT